MRITQPTIEGRFLRRYKRFFVDVELDDGSLIVAHCANTGSLLGCLEPGNRAVLRDSQDPERKLRHTLQALRVGETWVNVDTSAPNAVVHEAIERGEIPELTGYAQSKREVKYGSNSRIDVLLTRENGERCFVEVKNTTYAIGDCAAFPDAPTERGLKHLDELAREVGAGNRAVQFYFVSRNDVARFRPADEVDDEYGKALRHAAKAGVEVLAYAVDVQPTELRIARRLPVEL